MIFISTLKKRYRDLSINHKFLISLFSCLILPLLMIFVWVNTSVTRELEEQACHTALEMLKQAKAPIQSMVSDVDYTSKEILSNDAVQKYLKACKLRSNEELYEFRYPVDLFLPKLLHSRSYILRTALFSEDNLVAQFGAYQQVDALPDQAENLDLPHTGLHFLPAAENRAYISASEKGQEVIVLRSINDIQQFDIMLGVEKFSIREEYICGLYTFAATGETDYMMLLDYDGNIISSTNKEMLGTNVISEPWYVFMSTKQDGWLITRENQLVTYCWLPNPGWVLVRVDTRVPMTGIGIGKAVILICFVLTLVFAIVFIIIQRRNIIRPIMELTEEIHSFHDGNFSFNERRNAKDEIGILNRTYIEMGQYIQDLIERVYKSQLAEKEARLKTLQSQINPHFLYNTLESIRWMAIRRKQPEIARQVEALARFMKHALNSGSEMTTVLEEIRNIQDYITIQMNRFGDRITIHMDVDENAEECVVLSMVLQPLIENAFVHGLEEKMGQGCISVSIRCSDDKLVYTVSDNGLGTDAEAVCAVIRGENDKKSGLALRNISQRLRYKYGDKANIIFESTVGEGTCVTVSMPLLTKEETD